VWSDVIFGRAGINKEAHIQLCYSAPSSIGGVRVLPLSCILGYMIYPLLLALTVTAIGHGRPLADGNGGLGGLSKL